MIKIIIGSIAIFLLVSIVALLLGLNTSLADDPDVSLFEAIKRGYIFMALLALFVLVFAGLVGTIFCCFDLI